MQDRAGAWAGGSSALQVATLCREGCFTHSVNSEELLSEDSSNSHHGPSSVGLLGLGVPLDPLRVLSKAKGVKAKVSGE